LTTATRRQPRRWQQLGDDRKLERRADATGSAACRSLPIACPLGEQTAAGLGTRARRLTGAHKE
jgi:hypothetical protein